MAHPKHEQVRRRYAYRCGYCGVSEVDAGGDLTVDHYVPVARGGRDDDGNLVYACIRCNQYKGDFAPDADDLAHGRRVLHPLRDTLSEHIREELSTGFLQPRTPTGRFHIMLLQLNRPALALNRLRRRLAAATAEKERLLEAENAVLRQTVTEQRRYIARLQRASGLGPPPA